MSGHPCISSTAVLRLVLNILEVLRMSRVDGSAHQICLLSYDAVQ